MSRFFIHFRNTNKIIAKDEIGIDGARLAALSVREKVADGAEVLQKLRYFALLIGASWREKQAGLRRRQESSEEERQTGSR